MLLQQWHKTLAATLWRDIKIAHTLATGTSAYTADIKHRFDTFEDSEEALSAHYQVRTDRRCPLRNENVEQTLKGTASELQELKHEMQSAETDSDNSMTSMKVLNEAGDTVYGVMCYIVAWREQALPLSSSARVKH